MALPDWMRQVVVGSVLAERDGPWRVVRSVSRRANGDLHAVTFTIRRCSWTGRCYTVVMASDLKQRGFRLIPVRPVRLKGDMNQRIQAAIHGNEDRRTGYSMTCCDVEGVA